MLKSFKAMPIPILSELPDDLLEGVDVGFLLDRWQPNLQRESAFMIGTGSGSFQYSSLL